LVVKRIDHSPFLKGYRLRCATMRRKVTAIRRAVYHQSQSHVLPLSRLPAAKLVTDTFFQKHFDSSTDMCRLKNESVTSFAPLVRQILGNGGAFLV
jgi:hypothetical protein